MSTSLSILLPPSIPTPTLESPSRTTTDLEYQSSQLVLLVEPGMKVLNVSADVDEANGIANVWLLLKVKDFRRRDLSREAVMVMSWTRERGNWRCVKQSGLRGVAGYRM